MGGGTTGVETLVRQRSFVGADLNSLATFVTNVKTSPLSEAAETQVESWLQDASESISFRFPSKLLRDGVTQDFLKHLSRPKVRPIKKALRIALHLAASIPNRSAQAFCRCAVLSLGQWALDGRREPPGLQEVRQALVRITTSMLLGASHYRDAALTYGDVRKRRRLINSSAKNLPSVFRTRGIANVDLVVTSPPYPGVHVLYHRWQIEGRRESPAPYWVAGCADGNRPSYYTFGDRRAPKLGQYFSHAKENFAAVRKVVRRGAFVVQLVAFSDRALQLPRYLEMMEICGFSPVRFDEEKILQWRSIPNRKWHATLKGDLASAREAIMVHVAT